MTSIEIKRPSKPKVSGTLWSMLVVAIPTIPITFFYKNKWIPIFLAIVIYLLIYAMLWIVWLIRIHLYDSKIIKQNNETLVVANSDIQKLSSDNTKLEKENSESQSKITELKNNRDTLIEMNDDLNKENNELHNTYQFIMASLVAAATSTPEIYKFLNAYSITKEFTDDTKTIPYSEDNQ